MEDPPITDEDRARFWAQVASPNEWGCRLWSGSKHGRFIHGDLMMSIESFVSLTEFGVRRWESILVKTCLVDLCVEPGHLELKPVDWCAAFQTVCSREFAWCLRDHQFSSGDEWRKRCSICGWVSPRETCSRALLELPPERGVALEMLAAELYADDPSLSKRRFRKAMRSEMNARGLAASWGVVDALYDRERARLQELYE